MPDPSTTRLALYKSKSDGSETVNYSQDIGQNLDKIDAAVGYQSCTSSTRPSSPYSGKPIMETDTTYRTYFSNGTSPASASWVQIPNSSSTFNADLDLTSGKQVNIGGSGSTAAYAALLASPTGDYVLSSRTTGDSVSRIAVRADGRIELSSGTATADTNLYRSAADTLKTDDNLVVGGNLTVSGINQILRARKTGDTSVTSNVTPASDPHLVIAVSANAIYELEGMLFFTSASQTPDVLFGINGPSGVAGYWATAGPGTASTADPDTVRTIANAVGSSTRNYGLPTASQIFGFNISGMVETAGTAGNLTVDWSQNTSSATATTLKQYSWIRLIRVA